MKTYWAIFTRKGKIVEKEGSEGYPAVYNTKREAEEYVDRYDNVVKKVKIVEVDG